MLAQVSVDTVMRETDLYGGMKGIRMTPIHRKNAHGDSIVPHCGIAGPREDT